MRERKFTSAEHLAYSANRHRDQSKQNIGVTERTINNWRNNQNIPKKIENTRFQLVARALKLTGEELDQYIPKEGDDPYVQSDPGYRETFSKAF